MLHTCAESCGVCSTSPGGCVDQNSTACKSWERSGECRSNPQFMLKHCAATCGLCRTLCMDQEDACGTWAQAGECDTNPEVMLLKCPASCGVCSSIEQGGEELGKDEL